MENKLTVESPKSAGTLFSAVILDPANGCPSTLESFSLGKAFPLPGAPDRCALSTHTNVPRSGESGLPLGHKFDVNAWSALATVPLDTAVVNFFSDVAVMFEYNGVKMDDATLFDLVRDPPHRIGPVKMQPNMAYKVVLRVASEKHWPAFVEYLTKRTVDIAFSPREVYQELQGVVDSLRDDALDVGAVSILPRKKLQRIRERLCRQAERFLGSRTESVEMRPVTVWLRLHGEGVRVLP